MESWSTAVLEWVNCLDILDTHVNDLKELQDGKFYAKLIKILSEEQFEDVEDDKELVFRFIRDSYPEFLGERKEDEKKCKEIYIASLLLLYSSQDPKLHRPMCIKLSNETQIKIKSFLEKVLNHGSCVTKDNINAAIMETGENLVRTPPVTPKMRPLKDFFNSPATTVRKNYNRIMDERTREVRFLKAELETERFEKADLQQDLEIQRQKNNSLQQKLQEKIAEMKKIREDSTRLETPQSSRKRKEVKTPRNRFDAKVRELTEEIELLKAEIIDLQDEKQSLVRKLNSVERNCITFKERSKMNERNLETLLIQADLKDQEIQDLKNYNEELQTHINEMRRQTIEEQSFEMEMTTMSSANESLNGSEVLSSVIDIQLQEAKEESKIVRSQLADLNQRLQSVEGEYQVLQNFNRTLEAEVNLLQSTKQELATAQKELSECMKWRDTLEREKSHFEEQSTKFETLFFEKEKLLQESEERVETWKRQSHHLENKLEAALDLLSTESTRVRDLESAVSKKEEILKTECLRYNDLDQKHTKLKQEQLELLEETIDLKNLVTSQEESLKQVYQQRETLESNLRNLRSELKTMKDLLSSEKTTNSDLESTISKMKSEHENTRKIQMLRYQTLEETYVNLEREKDGLLQETKDLNLKIATTENLLQQSFEKNEIFASDLRDVKQELENTQHALTEERKKVEDLESRVRQIETDKQELVERQLTKYQTLEEKHINLERDKSRLAKDVEDLNNVISAKEQLLEQSSDERKNLESTLRELDEKLLTSQNSLGKERSRVKDLETTITLIKQEKEEALQSQLMSYQALEKIHINVEREKMNLLTESDCLKNLISSKDELLEQLQQQNGKLDLDLRDLNKDLQTVQDLLNTERTRVEDLKSTVSRMKLEHEETLEGQTLRYKDLKEKYVNLESEKVNLLEETKTLNHRIADVEDLITQSRQENEKLLSDLRDINLKFRTLQDSLAEERSKVVTLQCTVTRIKQEKEEISEQQSKNYQVLEKKLTDLEQEKSDLLEDTENLRNLVSSKEELLKQSKQHVAKLELDLCAMKDEMKTVQHELNTAKTEIKSSESVLIQTKLETKKIMQSNESLQAEIRSLESAKRDLHELKEQLHKQSEELKREKSRLLEDMENLKTDASSKEELLKQTQQRNDTLHSQLNDLDEEVKSVRSLLSAKSTRVEDLESTIARLNQEKEETLQSQFMSYQALEKKHTDLGQEKLDLLRDVENLKNLLSSKEGLLQQSQQRNAKLEVDLCAMKGEINTLRDELTTATIKVETLESALAQTKLEIDQIIRLNESLQAEVSSLESAKRDLHELKEQLHKQSEELKREKSRLLEDVENLTTVASLKEELLKQTQQQNESLLSQLNDLDEEVKSVRSLLSAKSSRVEDLESAIVQMKQEKEETLQSQSMIYQALEKKHIDLEQEKLDLLKDTEKLKTSLSSMEELVQQSQQQVTKFELDLCAIKDELKTVQNELKMATSKVESLESALDQSKLETDLLIQSNESLQAEICSMECAQHDLYEVKDQLQKRCDEFEEEKSCSQAEIENLKTNASLTEELLKQIRRENETLDLKLNDLGEEVKSMENLLSEKSTRVKDLESLIAEIESEKKESFSVIQRLELENVEQKSLIESCSLILTELVKRSSRLTSDVITDAGDSTILDLSKQLKTLINSLEIIHNTKDSDLKNFEATVKTLNSAVSELKTNMIHFEEMKIKNHLIISEYLKEITDLKQIAKEKENLLVDMDKLQKELSDERSKIDLLNEEKKLLDRNVFDVKRSLILLKNEKSILKKNVEDQNRELSTKIETISEVISKMKDQVRLDYETILHLGKEKTLLASNYEEEKKLRTELEAKCESLENENKSQTKEKKELKDKLNAIRVRNAKLEKNLDELRKENKKLETEQPSAEEQSEIEELKTSISKLQSQIKELETEKMEISKRPTEQDFNSRLKEVYIEYDQKLEKMKQKMKTAFNEQITKVNRDQERLMQEKLNAQRVKMEEQCRKHAEEITKYKDHVTKLSSDYWDVGEKLLVEKQQKEHFAEQLQDMRKRLQYERTAVTKNISQPVSAARGKTSSLDRREFVTNTREEASASRNVSTIKEEVTPCSRRESIQSVQTMQGMGNAFKVEDEEGEIFNTNYLADMKAGRCSDAPDLERLSVLQLRNAQCKPHLKSSYPAETQFQPGTFTEEEIKSGSALEDIFNDSLSQSLLPGEKTKKRDRTQTLYKRPGPPTPSKNGGRLSLQGNESRSPNSRILRERNVERRSTATPRRLKDLFGSSSRRQDENVSGTPKGRRLSSIFRKPK